MSGMTAVKSYRFLATGSGTFIIYLRDECAESIGEVVRMVVGLTGFLNEGNLDAVMDANFIGDFNGVHISPMPSSNIVTVVFSARNGVILFATMLDALGAHYGWAFDDSDAHDKPLK